jgi:hypothetical protein
MSFTASLKLGGNQSEEMKPRPAALVMAAGKISERRARSNGGASPRVTSVEGPR